MADVVKRLRLLEKAYWIACGVNPAQHLGEDAMGRPLTDEQIIEQAKLTASLSADKAEAERKARLYDVCSNLKSPCGCLFDEEENIVRQCLAHAEVRKADAERIKQLGKEAALLHSALEAYEDEPTKDETIARQAERIKVLEMENSVHTRELIQQGEMIRGLEKDAERYQATRAGLELKLGKGD